MVEEFGLSKVIEEVGLSKIVEVLTKNKKRIETTLEIVGKAEETYVWNSLISKTLIFLNVPLYSMEYLKKSKELELVLKRSIERRGLVETIERLRVRGRPNEIEKILHLWRYPGSLSIKVARIYSLIREMSDSSLYRLKSKADPLLRQVIDLREKKIMEIFEILNIEV